MAVDLSTATKSEINLRVPADDPVAEVQYSAWAVFDGERWSALCRELDIASDGDTAAEALANLKGAVREAAATAAEHGLQPGRPVSNADLREFLLSHRGPAPVTGQFFSIR